jgi:hypothetical protein
MIVFGGYDGSWPYRNDLWQLSLSGPDPIWSQLSPNGPVPAGRVDHTAVYDSLDKRMVTFGGWDIYDDSWELSLSGSPTWRQLETWGPMGRASHTAIYDSSRNRMIVFAGNEFYGAYDDAWALRWETPTGVESPLLRTADALLPCYPNPFNPRITIPFKLRQSGKATLSIFDVSGCLVATLLDGWTKSGTHSAIWDGTTGTGGQASSGIYFCRLNSGSFSATRKIVLLK